MISTASAMPAFADTRRMSSFGMRPVPWLPAGPSSFVCKMSREVLPVSPAAHAEMGRSNRRPVHHEGYRPVRCTAISNPPMPSVLPTRFAAIIRRSLYFAPASKKARCFL